MKFTYIIIACLLIGCGSKEETTETNIERSSSLESDSVIEEKPVEIMLLSVEDSVAFYKALSAENKLNEEFCKCAEKKGREHVDCRGFTKDAAKFGKIETDIINKYYSNSNADQAAVSRLSKAMRDEMDRYNACGTKK